MVSPLRITSEPRISFDGPPVLPDPNGHAHGFVLLVQTADGFTEIGGLETAMAWREIKRSLDDF